MFQKSEWVPETEYSIHMFLLYTITGYKNLSIISAQKEIKNNKLSFIANQAVWFIYAEAILIEEQ